jgi:hypothetical protein
MEFFTKFPVRFCYAGSSWKLPLTKGSVLPVWYPFWAEAKLFLSALLCVSSSPLSPKHPTAIPQEASKTQAINPQSSACSEAVINHSNGEEAIQSSKQMLKEDEDVDDDKEVNQAVLVCEHAMKASKNLPRKGEEASGKLCSELLRTFFDFSCLPG